MGDLLAVEREEAAFVFAAWEQRSCLRTSQRLQPARAAWFAAGHRQSAPTKCPKHRRDTHGRGGDDEDRDARPPGFVPARR